jgi:CRP/FNR family nitrogen fixation transcriptional regulator
MSLAYDFDTPVRAVQTSRSVACNETLDLMERMGVRLVFAKDEEIYGQDEAADLIYRVVKGAVRTSRLMSDGRRQIGDFHYEGDLFGLECGDTHAFSAEALGECIILMVKRSALRASGAAESLDRLIWDTTVRDLRRAQEHVMLLGRKTACERVASFLLNLADNADNSAIDLPMGRQDMADYLGLTIETVSRMLTQLQGSSVVEFTCARKFRVRNPAALARLAD